MRLARAGVQFRQFAGNTDILLTCIVPASWNYDLLDGRVVLSRPILTNPSSQRIGVIVPAGSLHRVILRLDQKGIQLEHLYDY